MKSEVCERLRGSYRRQSLLWASAGQMRIYVHPQVNWSFPYVAIKSHFAGHRSSRTWVYYRGVRARNCQLRHVGSGLSVGNAAIYEGDSKAVAELGNNEGVYVDKTTFKLHMGKPKAIPASEALAKGAHEVSTGAIIFRHDGKVYLMDAKPATE